ncbi:MAG TPA: thiamine phosphate synthase [Planctomycetes bacterium]|nr:thiamine phosphate synthase [Planctomycetota bacterium]
MWTHAQTAVRQRLVACDWSRGRLSQPPSPGSPPQLLAITAGDHGRGRDLTAWLQALGAAGLPAVLLREAQLDAHELDKLVASALNAIETVIVHARCINAVALCKQHPRLGLHLSASFDSTKLSDALWAKTSVSCHNQQELLAASSNGARFSLLSPVYRPLSKPRDERKPLGAKRFFELSADRPVLALGGITPQRHQQLLQTGGVGSAVCGALFSQPSPAQAVLTLRSFSTQAQDN